MLTHCVDCPWANNCVGAFNQKFFILFLFWTGVCSLYSGTILTYIFVSCSQNRGCRFDPVSVLFCVFNFIEALIFGTFVCIMIYDQFDALLHDLPYIDKLQGKKGSKRTYLQCAVELFGEPFSYRWFVPVNLPDKVYEEFETLCLESSRGVLN